MSVIKQPKPEIVNNTDNKAVKVEKKEQPERKIEKPHVGVITLPKISKTPISDTLDIKKKDNPRMKYKLTGQKKGKFSLKEIFSIGITAMGIVSLIALKKRK